MFRAIVTILWLASQAHAGAWLRETGDVFLSPSYSVENERGRSESTTFAGFYAEWGLGPNMTVGLDLGRPGKGKRTALVFARLPVMESTSGLLAAVELGIGVRDGAGHTHGFLRPGLSLGYGFNSRRGNGWLAMDLSADVDKHAAFDRLKADFTVGLSVSAHFKGMLQWHVGMDGGTVQHSFVPSVVLRTNDRQYVQLGVTIGRGSRRSNGFKLALWQEF